MKPFASWIVLYLIGVACFAACVELAIACARIAFRGNPAAVRLAVIGTVLAFTQVAVTFLPPG